MKLSNEFTVAVPIERAWATLLDIERVAGFLPGAKIEPSSDDGVYRGSMRVKVGPMVVNYEGTARLLRTEETDHVAEIGVEARDTKGQGTASAVIRNTLVADNGTTRVIAETELNITGRQAQFGRGIMQDIAGRMLDDFAHRFEAYLTRGEDTADPAHDDTASAPTGALSGPAGAGSGLAEAASGPPGAGSGPAEAASGPAGTPATEGSPDTLDLGSVLFRTPAVRRAGLVLGALALALLVFGRRRRS